jgi:hypothetical protein
MAKDSRRTDLPNTRWRAVSIIATESSCDAARALRTVRYLSAEAPRLPLPDCTCYSSCPCGYKHHADRRSYTRRKDELTGLKRTARLVNERRILRGRRSTDE